MGKIRRALISVSDKTGLIDLAKALSAGGIEILSTGGSATAIRNAGIDVRDVADVTGFPEMMDGRVKTLHPMVHGGLLALRDNDDHTAAMEQHGIGGIDLLIVNLYPFEETVAKGADYDTCIENIDIGGPAMICWCMARCPTALSPVVSMAPTPTPPPSSSPMRRRC